MPLPLGESIRLFFLKIFGNSFIKALFIIRRIKRDRNQSAGSVTHKLHYIFTQSPIAELTEPSSQIIQIAIHIGIKTFECRQITKHFSVNQGGKSVKFRKTVLQRSCRQKNFSAVFQRPADILSDFIALLVGVTQFVRFINHHKIPIYPA